MANLGYITPPIGGDVDGRERETTAALDEIKTVVNGRLDWSNLSPALQAQLSAGIHSDTPLVSEFPPGAPDGQPINLLVNPTTIVPFMRVAGEWVPITGAGRIPIGGTLEWDWPTEPPGPEVWIEKLGQEITKAEYPELFAVAGVTAETMNMPDLRGRSPMGAGQGPSLTNRIVGQLIGGETVTLSIAQLPSHNHDGSAAAAGQHVHGIHNAGAHQHDYQFGSWNGSWGILGTAIDPSGGPWVDQTVRQPGFPSGITGTNGLHAHAMDPAGSHSHTVTVGYRGSGQAVPNVHPVSVTRYFVRAR